MCCEYQITFLTNSLWTLLLTEIWNLKIFSSKTMSWRLQISVQVKSSQSVICSGNRDRTYWAPEQRYGHLSNKKSDVFSLGIIWVELWLNEFLWSMIWIVFRVGLKINHLFSMIHKVFLWESKLWFQIWHNGVQAIASLLEKLSLHCLRNIWFEYQ